MAFSARSVIDGSILVKKSFISWLPVIFLAVIMLVFYIANRYSIESTVKEMETLSKEIDNLQKRHSEQKGAYQRTTKMLEINTKLEQRGINVSKEQIKQVILIEDNKDKK